MQCHSAYKGKQCLLFFQLLIQLDYAKGVILVLHMCMDVCMHLCVFEYLTTDIKYNYLIYYNYLV